MNFINFNAWQSRCTGAASVLALCLCAQPGVAQTEQILFDDFNYTTTTQLTNNGWRVRTWDGGPGLANGTWSTNNISFVTAPASSTNKFMRLKASTNINGSTIVNNRSTTGSVSQAEVARVEQIYKNGTWATRMYFMMRRAPAPMATLPSKLFLV